MPTWEKATSALTGPSLIDAGEPAELPLPRKPYRRVKIKFVVVIARSVRVSPALDPFPRYTQYDELPCVEVSCASECLHIPMQGSGT